MTPSASPSPTASVATPPAHWPGRALVLSAAILWSASGLLAKSPALAALPEPRGLVIAFYRVVFAALVLVPFVRPRGVRLCWSLIPMVLSFATMNALFVSALVLTTAANAILLQYTASIWMILGSVALFGERLVPRNLLAVALGMLGVAVIVVGQWQNPDRVGIWLGLASGLAYAGVVLTLRRLRHEDPLWLTFVNHFASGLTLAPVLVAWTLWVAGSVSPGVPAAGAVSVLVPSLPALATLALFGVLQMGLPYVLFARGLRTVTPQEAGVLTLLEPVLNPLWVYLAWRSEIPAPATVLGGVIILSALAARYWPATKNKLASRADTAS